MAYIVGLTIVMQNLFWISEPWKGHPVTFEQGKKAMAAYISSDLMDIVHGRIGEFTSEKGVFAKEDVVTEIIQLLEDFKVDPNTV